MIFKPNGYGTQRSSPLSHCSSAADRIRGFVRGFFSCVMHVATIIANVTVLVTTVIQIAKWLM